MLGPHDYTPDGTAYCGRSGCGLPKRNWRHTDAGREDVEDRTEPRHTPDDQLVIPIQRGRTARQKKGATRARPRRKARY